MTRRNRLASCLALGAFVLGCQVGALDVPIGSDVATTFYVSPQGNDADPGTRERPWLTLLRATRVLQPGHTLQLLAGDYTPSTTGLLSVDCENGARSGRPDAPITVKAAEERRAALHGDGVLVPLELRGCANWVVEGLVLDNQHAADVAEGVDVGSVAMVYGGHDLTLRRLLLLRSNRERHSHVLRVLESARVLVEECEAYDFFHNAFEAVRSQAITFRRNYFHSRYASSMLNPVGADDATRGDVAIQVEESSSPVLENNLAEVVVYGFSVVGRSAGTSYTDPSPYPVSGARLYGNLVRDALGAGFRVETRCNDAFPCEEQERIARDTLIVHGVVLQAGAACFVDAAPGTRVDNVTAVDVTNGILLARSVPNAGLEFTASAARSLVRGFSGVAFGATNTDDWSFEHCAAAAPTAEAIDFSPHDERVRLPLSAPSDDACVAYLGPQSPLRGAAGVEGDVGASVVFRYVEGALGNQPLWAAETGAFPCGAVVAGINDDPSQSCIGAHERFRVGSAGCALPSTEGR